MKKKEQRGEIFLFGALARREGVALNKQGYKRGRGRLGPNSLLEVGKMMALGLHGINLRHSHIKVNSVVQRTREKGCYETCLPPDLFGDLAREGTTEAVEWIETVMQRGLT